MINQHQGPPIAARPVAGEDWRSGAACRFADPELFFPISDSGQSLEQVREAKAVCADCEVRRQCLAFAMRTRQVHGIWGGMTEQERHPVAAAGRDSVQRASSLPAHLYAGDIDGAAMEIEDHLRALYYMERLARPLATQPHSPGTTEKGT